MRFVKVGIGVVLIAFAPFVIFGEQLAGASADAFVNARLTTTRAPIAGTLRLQAPVLGSRIRRGDTLGEIADPLVDSVRLSDLVTEQAKNEAETAQISATLISVEGSIELLQTRAQTYRAERTRQLEAQLGASNATADASKAQLSLYRQMLQRSTQLSSRGVETTGSLEQAQSRVEVAQKELENALLPAYQPVGLAENEERCHQGLCWRARQDGSGGRPYKGRSTSASSRRAK